MLDVDALRSRNGRMQFLRRELTINYNFFIIRVVGWGERESTQPRLPPPNLQARRESCFCR
jgi:hypothetical protein